MSRALRIVAVVVAALLLTSFFIYLGFPYNRLGEYLSVRLEEATGTRLTLGDLDSKLFLQGPGLVAANVTAKTPGGDLWTFESLAVRPAWSLSWLSGRPAFYLDAATPYGEVRGVAVVAEPYAFDGEATGIDLSGLPPLDMLSGLSITGTADLVADVVFAESRPAGPLQLTAIEGTLGHPGLPLDVPYEEIVADLSFGGEQMLEITTLDIRSPMGSGKIRGRVGNAPNPENAALDLSIDVKVAEAIQSTFRAQGVEFESDGTLSTKITGTISRPLVR